MPDHDDRPDAEPVTKTDPAPAPVEPVHWRAYKLRKLTVYTTVIASKYCRVSELGEGYMAIEVEGLDPIVNEEPLAICLMIAEKSAESGVATRRYTGPDGAETIR